MRREIKLDSGGLPVIDRPKIRLLKARKKHYREVEFWTARVNEAFEVIIPPGASRGCSGGRHAHAAGRTQEHRPASAFSH